MKIHASQKKSSLFQRRYNGFKEVTISSTIPYISGTNGISNSLKKKISRKRKGKGKRRRESANGREKEKKEEKGKEDKKK